MMADSRKDELWRLIRFDKDATVDQLRLWCKELGELLIERDKDIYGIVETGGIFNLTPEWLKRFEEERDGLKTRNH